MNAMLQRNRKWLFLLGGMALAAGLCVTVVPETSQAVITRMGDPVRVINRWRPGEATGGGGLIAHLPVIERVTWIDRGLSSFTVERQAVRSADDQSLNVSATATFRVFDPVKLVDNAGSADKAVEQMRTILSSLAQQELGTVEAAPMLMPGSGGATARLRAALDTRARAFGIQVVDLRLSGAGLPESDLQQAYERMEASRDQLAQTIRQEGLREAQDIAAQAQAEAAHMLGAAAGKDPEFYDFYRAMRSYETVFANAESKGTTTIVLGPDSAYLKQFKGP